MIQALAESCRGFYPIHVRTLSRGATLCDTAPESCISYGSYAMVRLYCQTPSRRVTSISLHTWSTGSLVPAMESRSGSQNSTMRKPRWNLQCKPYLASIFMTRLVANTRGIVHDNLDTRSFVIFKRLHRFYKTLNVVSALVAGLSLANLTFSEFHPTDSALIRASEGLLCSSATTSVIAVMLLTMLLFKFEARDDATRKDMIIAWTPLVLLDIAIVEYLLGLLLWYASKTSLWRILLVASHLCVLLGYCVWVAVWMYKTRPAA